MEPNKLHKSAIYWKCIISQGEVNGRWVIETRADNNPIIGHPAGTLVCEPADDDASLDITFTAKNGKIYYDIPEKSFFTPRV